MSTIIYPEHYRILECRSGRWFLKHSELFYSHSDRKTEFDTQKAYGISTQQLALNSFRVNGGKTGYYLADLKAGEYHYCGTKWDDITVKLKSLGIGRDDPLE